MIKVSVIIPVYNIETYIERCVNSILSQTFKNFELILVDDGSNDDSGIICDQYAKMDERVKVVHKKNQGVSSARNLGIGKAQGEYIVFIDGDDWVKKDYLEQLYRNITAQQCDICICGGNEIDEQMKELRVCKFQKKQKLDRNDYRLYDWPFFTYVIHRMMINRRILDQISFDVSLSNGEDVLFLTEVFLNASKGILFIPYTGYSYYIRTSGANQHNSYSKKKFSAVIAYEKRLQRMKESGLKMQASWYKSFVLEVYCLYGFIVFHPEFYEREHADILYGYLKKYRVYRSVLGESYRFKIKYWFMEHSQRIMEYMLKRNELPHGHIVS